MGGTYTTSFSSVVAKGLITHASVIFQLFLVHTFANICKMLFYSLDEWEKWIGAILLQQTNKQKRAVALAISWMRCIYTTLCDGCMFLCSCFSFIFKFNTSPHCSSFCRLVLIMSWMNTMDEFSKLNTCTDGNSCTPRDINIYIYIFIYLSTAWIKGKTADNGPANQSPRMRRHPSADWSVALPAPALIDAFSAEPTITLRFWVTVYLGYADLLHLQPDPASSSFALVSYSSLLFFFFFLLLFPHVSYRC